MEYASIFINYEVDKSTNNQDVLVPENDCSKHYGGEE